MELVELIFHYVCSDEEIHVIYLALVQLID